MDKNKILGLVGFLISFVGLFLPFYGDGSMFINGIGIFALILLIAVLFFIFVINNKMLSLILTGLVFIINILFAVSESISNVKIGFYVIIIGLIVIVISQILSYEKEEDKLEPIKEEVNLKYYEKPVKEFQRFSDVTKDGSFKMREIKPPQINNNGLPNNSSFGLNSSGFPTGGVNPPNGMNNMYRKK